MSDSQTEVQTLTVYGLRGRIVTMDENSRIFQNGVIYIRDGIIVNVVENENLPRPTGFEACPVIRTQGTIYPGMIELHNHLSYNIVPIWNVPQKYGNRAEWAGSIEKRKSIYGPVKLLTDVEGYTSAIIRYVECKCLLAGVTTSQGITLSGANGIEKKYRGLVRNIEEPDNDGLPKTGTKIPDVEDAPAFLKQLRKWQALVLHLSEGVDSIARQHFLSLKLPDGTWAITDALIGIHSTGLQADDFKTLKAFGGSMVWSPLSNLLLYGQTADVKAAKEQGVMIALGSDWSPSGSKNLLWELKVARLYSQNAGDLFSDEELVQMVTTNPARMLKWHRLVGSIESGKLADLLVIGGVSGDPYQKLVECHEGDIRLVVIGGTARYGTLKLTAALGQTGEVWQLGSRKRVLNLNDVPDETINTLTLAEARRRLQSGLQNLPNPPAVPDKQTMIAPRIGHIGVKEKWTLDLDNDGTDASELRPLASTNASILSAESQVAVVPLNHLVEPIELDELTVFEAPAKYFNRIRQQINLPAFIQESLFKFFRSK